MSFKFSPLDIPDVILVRSRCFQDKRGYFSESYRHDAFADAGIDQPFVQFNRARSVSGVLRGLHFQAPPHSQGKLVEVTRGAIWDVAVDLRSNEPTFGQWVGMELTSAGELLWIPAGFAHGYVALTEEADVSYAVTSYYAPESEGGILWSDPSLAIDWPTDSPIVSEKDLGLPLLKDVDSPFT